MRVVITDRFAAEGVSRLAHSGLQTTEVAPGSGGDALADALKDAEALVVRSQTQVDAKLLDGAPMLLAVGRAGVGCENIDVEQCAKRGIAVMNTPGASAITTGERALSLMLSMLHQIPAADRSVRAGKWDRRSFMSTEAFDKTIGILGFGNIGRVVADRASGLRMKVQVHDANLPPEAAFNIGFKPVGFDELFSTSDIISIHVTGDAKLKGLVGARELGLMKRGSFLINTSRGFLVDEAALVAALEAGQLKGCGLDVFEAEPLPESSKLRAFEQVVFSPHLGASSAEAEKRVALSIADTLSRFLLQGVPSNLVARPHGFRHKLVSQR